MKNKILAILLSFTLIFTTTVLGFAEDEVGSSSEPEKQSEQVVADNTKKAPVEVNVEKEDVVKEEPTLEKEATTESNEATKDAPAAKKSEANVKGAAAVQSTQDGEDDISINAKPKSMSIEVGKTEINNPIIGGESGDVTVESDDETVATVVWENGVAKVTGVAEGTAIITYTLKSGTKEATDDFTVTVVASGQEYVNVTFKDFFGNAIENELVVKGKMATMPAGPEMEGYQFAGWKIGSEETTYQEGAQVTVNDDTVFKATYTQAKYTVSCSTSHGTVTPASQEIVAGRYASKPTLNVSGNEIKKGDEIEADGKYYKFLGWYNGDIEYGFNEPVVGNVTLTAKWQKVQCTVTFISAMGVMTTTDVDKGSKNVKVKAPEIKTVQTAPAGVDRNTYKSHEGYFAKKADGTAVDREKGTVTDWLYFHRFERALNTDKDKVQEVNSGEEVTIDSVDNDIVFNALYAPKGMQGDPRRGLSSQITVEIINEVTGEHLGSQTYEMIVSPQYGDKELIPTYTGKYVEGVNVNTAKFGIVDMSEQISDTIEIEGKTYNVDKNKSTDKVKCVWLCDTGKNHVYGKEKRDSYCGGGSWLGTGTVYIYASLQPEAGKANLTVNYCLNSASNIITSESYALDNGDTMSSAPYVNKYKSSYGEAGTPAWVTGSEGAEAEEGNTYELNIIYHTGPFKLTINYVDEEGVELKKPFVQENMYRTDPYRQESPDIEGYILKDSRQAVISGQMGSSDVEIDVVYKEKKFSVTYTDGVDGEEVFKDQVTTNLKKGVDTPAFEGTPEREGYIFSGWAPKVSETVTGDATYVAQWRPDKVNYAVEYYYQKNGEYGEPDSVETRKGVTGTEVTLTEGDVKPKKDGYVLDKDNENTIKAAEVKADGSTALRVYFEEQFNVIIHYVDKETGYEVEEARYENTMKWGDKLDVLSPVPPTGYKLENSADERIQETIKDDFEYTVYYVPIEYNVVIHYVDEEGNELAKDYTDVVRYGKSFEKASPEIEGYELVNEDDVTVSAENVTEPFEYTVVYKKIPVPVPTPDPDNPDNPVVGPTNGNAVKTGDADACWASLNLILALATCVIAFMMIISMLMRRDDEEIEDTKAFFESSWFERILSGVVGVFALLVFLITENMNLPMVWTDRWTFMMIVIFTLQILVVAFAKNKDKAVEEE